ncbi:MAG: glycosyltransferase family 39 protein, partial [Tumebacillaceae bacterium]
MIASWIQRQKKFDLFRYVLLTLFLIVGLVLRWKFDQSFQPNWYGDQIEIIRNGRAVAGGTYFSTFSPYWPPGAIVVQGIVFKLFGIKAFHAVFYLQAIMSTVTILFVEAAARRLFGKVAGLVAAGICAIYVPFIYYTAIILSETTFFFFTMAAVAMLARYMDTNKRRDLVFAGILFGLSALTRPVSAPLPLLAFFLFWMRKNGMSGWGKLFAAMKK